MTLLPPIFVRFCRSVLPRCGPRNRPRHRGRAFAFAFLLLGAPLAASPSQTEARVVLVVQRVPTNPGVAEVAFSGLPGSPGTWYRLDESCDLTTWNPRRTGLATGGATRLSLRVDELDHAFFRLELSPVEMSEQMVWIAPGEFVMGSPAEEVGRFLDKEEPQTRVVLTRGFWISRFEVTQAEFAAVMGFNPSLFSSDSQRPVEDVTWFEAVGFCERLTARERQAGRLPAGAAYRLPTESEWEFAARAGTTTRFSHGDDPGYQVLRAYAWYGGNSGLRTHPVGLKLPNPWGLYDMHGNVFEWCLDWFDRLPGGSQTDPPGPATGLDRVIRGGYWDSGPALCRSAVRVHFPPTIRISYLGFRTVLAEIADH